MFAMAEYVSHMLPGTPPRADLYLRSVSSPRTERREQRADVHSQSSSPNMLGRVDTFPFNFREPWRLYLSSCHGALGDLLGVPLVVELQEAGEDHDLLGNPDHPATNRPGMCGPNPPIGKGRLLPCQTCLVAMVRWYSRYSLFPRSP